MMDWLGNLQPGTAWALVAGVAIIAGAAIALFALIPRRYRRIQAKNLQVGPDGEVKIRHASLADEEVKRLGREAGAEAIAVMLPVLRKELAHECIQRDLLTSVVGLVEPTAKTAAALADEAIERGKNGRIKEGREALGDALATLHELQAERVVG